jgi:hypothetical protein
MDLFPMVVGIAQVIFDGVKCAKWCGCGSCCGCCRSWFDENSQTRFQAGNEYIAKNYKKTSRFVDRQISRLKVTKRPEDKESLLECLGSVKLGISGQIERISEEEEEEVLIFH